MVELKDGMLLGMGNPLLDISATVDENLLQKYNLEPDNAILAEEKHLPLYDELVNGYNADLIAGGSVQNALRVAQWILGKPNTVTFFGCVGEDKFSKLLEDKARTAGVNVQYQYSNKDPTGTCAVCITGSQRSLCANLAAANNFTIEHIQKPENYKFVEAAQYYYVSGFFLTVSPKTILHVAEYAYTNNRMFLMNLSAPFISQFYKNELMEVFPYVDILFGNETEAETFAKEQNLNSKDPKEIALKICEMDKKNTKRPRVTIITQGALPVILAVDGKVKEFPVSQLTKEQLVDTNGAGDAFVGGFLAQLLLGQSLETCIKCGIWTATHIVQRSGCTYEGLRDLQILLKSIHES